MEPGAVDEPARAKSTSIGTHHHRPTRLGDALHLGTRSELATILLYNRCKRLRHLREIDDPRARHLESSQAARVGLYLPKLLRAYFLHLDTILQALLVEVVEER
jgi:hypothetical protein